MTGSYRWFCWISIVILLLGFAIEFAVHGFSLPYVEPVDEPNMYLIANDQRGKLDAGGLKDWLAGYPPAYFWISARIMDGLDAIKPLNIYTDMGVYIRALRIVSIWASLITVALIMAVAFWLGGSFAGVIAGLVWVLSSYVLSNEVVAFPDPLAIMFGTLCVAGGVRAILRSNPWYALLGTASGLLAVFFKYPLLPVLLVPAYAFMALFLRKRAWLTFGLGSLALVLVGLSGGALLQFGALSLSNDEGNQLRGSFIQNLVNGVRWQVTVNSVLATVGIALFVVAVVSVGWIILTRRTIRHTGIMFSLMASGFGLVALVPIYLKGHDLAPDAFYKVMHYTLPACAVLLIPTTVIISRAFVNHARWLLVTALITTVGLVPATIDQVADKSRPSTYALAQAWVEQNAPDRTDFWASGLTPWRLLSRFTGGYPGFKTFGAYYGSDQDNPTEMASKISFLVVAESDFNDLFQPVWSNYPLTLLKAVKNTGLHGESIYFYVPGSLKIQETVDFANGKDRISLVKHQLDWASHDVKLSSMWQAPAHTPSQDYSSFMHLISVDDPGRILAQADGPPSFRPTSSWIDTSEVIQGSVISLKIPDLAPGDYRIIFGLYDWKSGQRLNLSKGQTFLELDHFSIL